MLDNFLFTERFAFSATDSVLVVGLGRFGSAVAQSLMALGHEVMGIDVDEQRVQDWSHRLTHAVQADSSNVEVLRQLGAADFSHAIIGIGNNLSSSLLAVMAMSELGIKDIWVKATNAAHGQIAERIGAHHVVYPEAAMGERVAHLISGKMIDFIEFDDGFAIAKIQAPGFCHNMTLDESRIREIHHITVVGVKRQNEDFTYAKPDTFIKPGDLLIVSGPTQAIEKFASKINPGKSKRS